MSEKTYVVLRTATDSTGCLDIKALAVFRGDGAESAAYRLKNKLDAEARRDPSIAHLVCIAGEE